jgi:hypothetical protein
MDDEIWQACNAFDPLLVDDTPTLWVQSEEAQALERHAQLEETQREARATEIKQRERLESSHQVISTLFSKALLVFPLSVDELRVSGVPASLRRELTDELDTLQAERRQLEARCHLVNQARREVLRFEYLVSSPTALCDWPQHDNDSSKKRKTQ